MHTHKNSILFSPRASVSTPSFDPAAWLQKRYRVSPATARLLADIIGFHRPDDHIGAPAKKAVRQ